MSRNLSFLAALVVAIGTGSASAKPVYLICDKVPTVENTWKQTGLVIDLENRSVLYATRYGENNNPEEWSQKSLKIETVTPQEVVFVRVPADIIGIGRYKPIRYTVNRSRLTLVDETGTLPCSLTKYSFIKETPRF